MLNPDRMLRSTGIDIIGDVPWGTHFCHFYQTRQDLIDILIPFFKAGLENDEFCMWITSEPLTQRDAEAELRKAMPDFDRYVAKGAIEILPHTEWYLIGGSFEQKRVLDGWVERHDRARERGFAGLRLSGNTFWLEDTQWKDFADYEHAVNDVIGQYHMIAICTYSLDRCGASEVIDVVRNHQFALIKRENRWTLFENSERKRAAEMIERLNRDLATKSTQLEAANRDLESFNYSVSHDLRAPLRALDGFAKILSEDYGPKLDAEGNRLLNILRDSTAKMQKLIDDLLRFSRTGRAELNKADVDMEALVQSIRKELSQEYAGRTVQFVVLPMPHAWGDEPLLHQVWSNLIGNALKFTRPRQDARIEIGAQLKGNETIYFVRDNGVGFDMQYAGRLFGVFQRLHSPKQFEGTGIGLAIVKRIVDRHGGRVWAEGKPDEGATFSFVLPSREDAGK